MCTEVGHQASLHGVIAEGAPFLGLRLSEKLRVQFSVPSPDQQRRLGTLRKGKSSGPLEPPESDTPAMGLVISVSEALQEVSVDAKLRTVAKLGKRRKEH